MIAKLLRAITLVILLKFFGISTMLAADGPPIQRLSAIASGMEYIGKAVDDPDYYIWCTSPIMEPDGKVHLFCSRMPKQYGFDWSRRSEIAHYVGDRPEGPFKFVNVALPANPDAPWNNSIHNPAISRVGNKYVLLYITFDHRKDSPWLLGETPGCGKMYTCMAVADSLNGPWKLLGKDGMIIEPSTDPNHWTYQSWSMDNPTFIASGGKYYIYFKGGRHQGSSQYGYAVASNLEGPYKLSDAPCMDNISYVEDATAFYWNNKFCLLTTDNYGTQTGMLGAGILWKSDVPTDFKLANAEIGFLLGSIYCRNLDLSKAKDMYGNIPKFERPGVLMVKGRPSYFYAPSGVNFYGEDRTISYVLKIDLDHPNPLNKIDRYHATATASGSWGIDYEPDKAVDGSPATRWSASRPERASWIAADLGSEHEVGRISLYESYNRITQYELQVKQSDGSWKDIAKGTQLGNKDFPFFPPVKGREFRLNILDATDTPSISEFQFTSR